MQELRRGERIKMRLEGLRTNLSGTIVSVGDNYVDIRTDGGYYGSYGKVDGYGDYFQGQRTFRVEKCIILKQLRKNEMNEKIYRVIGDNPLWEKGAILFKGSDGYMPKTDVWNKVEHNEYLSSGVVEKSPAYFERVYEVSLVGKVAYVAKEKAREIMGSQYKGDSAC